MKSRIISHGWMVVGVASALLIATAHAGPVHVKEGRCVPTIPSQSTWDGNDQSSSMVQAKPVTDSEAGQLQKSNESRQIQPAQPRVWLTTSEVDGQSFVTAHWEGLKEPTLLVFKKVAPKLASSDAILAAPEGPSKLYLGAPICVFVAQGAGERTVQMLHGPLVGHHGTVSNQISLLAASEISVSLIVRHKKEAGQPKSIPKAVGTFHYTASAMGPGLIAITGKNGPNGNRFLVAQETREFEVPENGWLETFAYQKKDVIAESNAVDLPKH